MVNQQKSEIENDICEPEKQVKPVKSAGIDIAYHYVLKEVDVQIMNTTRRGGFVTFGPNFKLLVYLSKEGSPYKLAVRKLK